MRAIILMFDSLNRHMLAEYGDSFIQAPNFARLARQAVTFDNFYSGSMPCMPARREMHTGRYNFLHRSWGPLEPFDDSMPEMLGRAGIHTHLITDHQHYWEDGGATYHTRYTTFELFRGQEGDPWKAEVGHNDPRQGVQFRMPAQDKINRRYMPTEADQPQSHAVDAGIAFLDTNAGADNWMLQLELFDPHEPFFTHQQYQDLYPSDYEDQDFDWPGYQKVTEGEEAVEHARKRYAALVTMCDRSLGRVLDAMDRHHMWDDTLLIVNTDHGFLLGEHGWWAKSVQPWFNELVHIPMFMWDPRTRGRDMRRRALAQTIDLAPTVLSFFGVEPSSDMQGRDLAAVLKDDADVHAGALFGTHGGHVNVTDGRYVYMRASQDASNSPLAEYTMMPTHMRARFSPDELAAWEPAEPFTFTKGLRTMRVPAESIWLNPWRFGTQLFDLATDPGQEHPIVDDEVEMRMATLLVELMRDNDAPAEQFERLGLPATGEVEAEHLHCRVHLERAQAMAEPLPAVSELAARELLEQPLRGLLAAADTAAIIARHAPELVRTELVHIPPAMSLLDLAAAAQIPAAELSVLDQALAAHQATQAGA